MHGPMNVKVILLPLITTRIFNHCIVSRVAAIHNSLSKRILFNFNTLVLI
jgi:hypothetical protein